MNARRLLYILALTWMLGPGPGIGQRLPARIQARLMLPDHSHLKDTILLNPFSLCLVCVLPVIDVVMEDLYHNGTLIHNDIAWKPVNTHLSEDQCTVLTVQENAHVLFGFALISCVERVATISPLLGWNGTGTALVTTIARNTAFKNKQQYKLLTRMTGDYETLSTMFSIFAREAFLPNGYRGSKITFLFNSPNYFDTSLEVSECYFAAKSIKDHYRGTDESVPNDHHLLINEYNDAMVTKHALGEMLKTLSMKGNGRTTTPSYFSSTVSINNVGKGL